MKYTHPDAVTFVKDMARAGLEVEHYHGRFFWEGPAVRVDDLQDALSVTKVRCQWDNMGRGWIVYPRAGDAGVEVVQERTRAEQSADEARERWESACASGMEHGTVLRYWESYVRLAKLAGIRP